MSGEAIDKRLDEALDATFPASDPLPAMPGTEANTHATLFYLPGSCALGVHIALIWADVTFEARRLERADLRSRGYLALNAAGVVPTLILDGQVMTEATGILLALARRFPNLGPGAEATEAERIRFERLRASPVASTRRCGSSKHSDSVESTEASEGSAPQLWEVAEPPKLARAGLARFGSE